ncbi:MAG: hypothetical protein ACQEWW_26200 [Bacillota bacterium]
MGLNLEEIKQEIDQLKDDPKTMYNGMTLSKEFDEICEKLKLLQGKIADIRIEAQS